MVVAGRRRRANLLATMQAAGEPKKGGQLSSKPGATCGVGTATTLKQARQELATKLGAVEDNAIAAAATGRNDQGGTVAARQQGLVGEYDGEGNPAAARDPYRWADASRLLHGDAATSRLLASCCTA
jgi:hypothetical protein